MLTFNELKNKISKQYSLFVLESWISKERRHFFRQLFLVLFLILLGSLIVKLLPAFEGSDYKIFVDENIFQIRGFLFISFSLWMFLGMLDFFYFSIRSRDVGVNFEVSRLIFDSRTKDVIYEFISDQTGRFVLMRCGISSADILEFLKKRKKVLLDSELKIDPQKDGRVDLVDYGRALFSADQDFSDFLQSFGINQNDFESALLWIQDFFERKNSSENWWSRENLLKIKSLGRTWSFGDVYSLEKYGLYITEDESYRSLSQDWQLYLEDSKKIEEVISKNRDANVLVLSETVQSGMAPVATLAKKIFQGQVPARLESFKVFVLNGQSILDSFKDKTEFENEFTKIISQSASAGNIILVIPHMAQFFETASSRGSNLTLLLGQALDSTDLHVIGVSDKNSYHSVIEPNLEFKRHFEKINLGEFEEDRLVAFLRIKAEKIEAHEKVFFTVQALREVAQDAIRLFVSDSGIDKAMDLLDQIATSCAGQSIYVIGADEAQEVISTKTGVPRGEIKSDEREKLSKLEDVLHKRVIEQNSAIEAVSNALRRARSGLTNPKRPLGSFLFLGPTGVGKTETAKALAEIFFGSENEILRLDMSEFTGEDALEKMIGSHVAGSTGVLASRMRDKPYGVLLLDEFEKTTDKVKNLFLQILDEGIFSDGLGNKVSARNLIVIATSNAGSDLIYQNSQLGKEIESQRQVILDEIIHRGIYRPELLNRFDGIILFHPLSKLALSKVAELQINKLNDRLKEKGIELLVEPDLIEFLSGVGLDPKFGARALNRAIQDQVESLIAKKIVDGTIKNGTKISLKKGLTGLEIQIKE